MYKINFKKYTHKKETLIIMTSFEMETSLTIEDLNKIEIKEGETVRNNMTA